jgi:hypothetical protein
VVSLILAGLNAGNLAVPHAYSGHGRIHRMADRNAHMQLRSQIQSYRDESPHGLHDL